MSGNAETFEHGTDRWARALLEISPDAGDEEVRHEILRRLDDCNLAPPMDVCCAIAELMGERVPPQLSWEAREARFSKRVGEFASRFFELPCAARAREWDELFRSSAEFPAQKRHLESLRRGLAVDVSAVDKYTGAQRALAKFLCESFVMIPAERAVARREQAFAIANDRLPWQNAAAQLQRDFPQLTGLDADWIDGLVRSPRKKKRRRRKPAAKTAAPRGSDGSSGKWVVLIVIIGALRLFSALARHNHSSHEYGSYYNPPSQSFQIPPHELEHLVRNTSGKSDDLRYFRAIGRIESVHNPVEGRTVDVDCADFQMVWHNGRWAFGFISEDQKLFYSNPEFHFSEGHELYRRLSEYLGRSRYGAAESIVLSEAETEAADGGGVENARSDTSDGNSPAAAALSKTSDFPDGTVLDVGSKVFLVVRTERRWVIGFLEQRVLTWFQLIDQIGGSRKDSTFDKQYGRDFELYRAAKAQITSFQTEPINEIVLDPRWAKGIPFDLEKGYRQDE